MIQNKFLRNVKNDSWLSFNNSNWPQFDALLADSGSVTSVDHVCHILVRLGRFLHHQFWRCNTNWDSFSRQFIQDFLVIDVSSRFGSEKTEELSRFLEQEVFVHCMYVAHNINRDFMNFEQSSTLTEHVQLRGMWIRMFPPYLAQFRLEHSCNFPWSLQSEQVGLQSIRNFKTFSIYLFKQNG